MEVRKLRFLSSCQYTHGCYAPASWAARHTTVCLDINLFTSSTMQYVVYVCEHVHIVFAHFVCVLCLYMM